MNDREGTAFLQWALPRLGLRWRGFRRVRGQVIKRVGRRLAELDLPDVTAYRELLERRPEEWQHLQALCLVTISRFWRDRAVFDGLVDEVLPALAEQAVARGHDTLRCWSAGCASGEEPYSLSLAWSHRLRPRFGALDLQIVATDAHPLMIERAREARYPASSLRDLPTGWLATDFVVEDDLFRLADEHRQAVDLRLQDLRETSPDGLFDLVLCRNLAFTYFDEPAQRRVLARIEGSTSAGGALVLGNHEALPEGADAWTPWHRAPCVFTHRAGQDRAPSAP